MSQPDTAPADDDKIPNITAHEFFSRVPDGVFNLTSSYTDLDDYESLHHVIHKNKQCKANWEAHLRKNAHHAKPLFDVFTSVKALRFVFDARKIDVRDWELQFLIAKNHYGKGKHKYMTHKESFCDVCKEGLLDIVKAMQERTLMDLRSRDQRGLTPMHYAAENGHLPVVQYLCEQGANNEARSNGDRTPLHLAAYEGHLPVVQYLCKQGADKETKDNCNMTPLHWAAVKDHLPVVKYLCKQGADKEASDTYGRTPLNRAAQEGHLPVVKYLCEQKANKDTRDKLGETPLDSHHVSVRGYVRHLAMRAMRMAERQYE